MENLDLVGDKEKELASEWFQSLRNQICNAFEKLEIEQSTGPYSDLNPGKFERKETHRSSETGDDGGGGVMSVMRSGRLFEKVGVNISTVYGTLGEAAQNLFLQEIIFLT
tara:strand:+ start:307 stop:636 length:330 start_codon:yes stop_codon:yes gene_type:complete